MRWRAYVTRAHILSVSAYPGPVTCEPGRRRVWHSSGWVPSEKILLCTLPDTSEHCALCAGSAPCGILCIMYG